MSHGIESKESVKRRNAQPARSKKRGEQGNLFQRNNPGWKVEHERRRVERNAGNPFAAMLQQAYDPITIESENILVTSDWHIPFQDETLVKRLFAAAEEFGTQEIAIVGDFFDCDNISVFNSEAESRLPLALTFNGEKEEVAKMLRRILNVFETTHICAGNHERRWSAITSGKSGIVDLYRDTMPALFDGGKWEGRARITSDDHMVLNHHGQDWLLCHPRNFRITPLSVARDLAAKHHKHIFMAHGHGFCQGRDRSGEYICLDGGGLFDRRALEYARRTTCHPMTRSGFYLLKDGIITPFEGC